MTMADSNREFAAEVVNRLKAAGYQALWAGGCVRDLLLGRTPKDYDVATNARPDAVRALFGQRRTLAIGASFGVIVVRGPRHAANVEVATFRTEGPYLDGRRPESVAFATPEEDAKRRDFTINGMFYDPSDQQVLDYVGGERDLSAGILRAIGDPRDRMTEDKLRMLRAVRFAANLDFELDPLTALAIREMAEQLPVVSPERITQELKRLIVNEHRSRGLRLTQELGLLRVIFPELDVPSIATSPPKQSQWERTLHGLHLLQEPSFELAMATFWLALPESDDLIETAEALGRRLRLSNQENDQIAWLLRHQRSLDHAPDLPLSRLKRLLSQPRIEELLNLIRIRRLTAEEDLQPVLFCEEFLRTTPQAELNPPPLITGEDLVSWGLMPGPLFKDYLEAVRDAQLNGEIRTANEVKALFERLRSPD